MLNDKALPPLDHEREAWRDGLVVCGVDEAGRGPLFGPLVVGAVVLSLSDEGIEAYDSKTLSKRRREILADGVRKGCTDWSVGLATALEIDSVGLSEALRAAAVRAIDGLRIRPDVLLIDGKYDFAKTGINSVTLVKGETKSRSIAAASLVAKVTRDNIIDNMAHQFPGYGLDKHGGYGTKEHLEAIASMGPTSEHRWSFAPIKIDRPTL